jgi:DNA repair protein RadC
MTLKHLPAELRPREKLLSQGAAALADAELLALLLRTGLKGMSVLELAQLLLDTYGGMGGLLQADAQDLQRIKGIGPAKRAEMAAVLEIARRALAATLSDQPIFDSPEMVKDFLSLNLAQRAHEVFAVLYLDARHRLIRFEEMFRGTLTQTSVYPREVVKQALSFNAAAVVLAHNHPSGAKEPSRADEYLTQTLKSALALVDVRVLDHMIVTRGGVTSFSERGLL